MTSFKFNELMKKVNDGDMSALKEIYSEYSAYVYQIAFAILKNKEDSEDVSSDVFLKLWEKSWQYKPGMFHKGYLATITRNLALDLLRRNSKVVDFESVSPLSSSVGDAETLALDSVTIEDALNKLKSDEREVIHLKFFGGLTFSEIASVMGIPQGTVSWKYSKAMDVLRRCGYEEL